MIPKSEYIPVGKGKHKFDAVTMALIEQHHTPGEAERFARWLLHQTCAVLPNGDTAIYVEDYERWLRQGCRDSQQAKDWD